MSKKEHNYTKEKAQLLSSLIEQAKKKGYIKASTIQTRFARHHPSEQEMEDAYASFEAAGIEVMYAEDQKDNMPTKAFYPNATAITMRILKFRNQPPGLQHSLIQCNYI